MKKVKIFKPKYFAKTLDQFAKEILPPNVYKQRGVKGLQLFDIELLEFVDEFRNVVGVSIYINDWSWGGGFSQSGLRDEGYYGSPDATVKSFSQHRFGNAVDIKCKTKTGSELRKIFIENKEKFPQISFVECGPVKQGEMTWAHFDTRLRLDDVQVKYWSPIRGFVTEDQVLQDKL